MSGRTSQMNEPWMDLGKPNNSRDDPWITHADVKGCGPCSDVKEVRDLTGVGDPQLETVFQDLVRSK